MLNAVERESFSNHFALIFHSRLHFNSGASSTNVMELRVGSWDAVKGQSDESDWTYWPSFGEICEKIRVWSDLRRCDVLNISWAFSSFHHDKLAQQAFMYRLKRQNLKLLPVAMIKISQNLPAVSSAIDDTRERESNQNYISAISHRHHRNQICAPVKVKYLIWSFLSATSAFDFASRLKFFLRAPQKTICKAPEREIGLNDV